MLGLGSAERGHVPGDILPALVSERYVLRLVCVFAWDHASFHR